MSKAELNRFHHSDSGSSLCGSTKRSGSLAQVCHPSRDSVCNVCRRSTLHPNPTPNKLEALHVYFISSTYHRCKGWRAFLRPWVLGKEAQFLKEMQDYKRETEFLPAWSQFEKVCLKKVRDLVELPWCSSLEQQRVRDIVVCCVFWPRWVYEIEEKPTSKEACETYVSGNTNHFGIRRYKNHGNRQNTISTKVVSTFSRTADSRLASAIGFVDKGALQAAKSMVATVDSDSDDG